MVDRDNPLPKDTASGKKPPCQVTFWIGEQAYRGSSRHFNSRGMLILCPKPARLKTKLKISLQFPGFKHSLEVLGEVVWTNVHGHADLLSPRGMGVKFSNLDSDANRMLTELAEQYETYGNMYECYYT